MHFTIAFLVLYFLQFSSQLSFLSICPHYRSDPTYALFSVRYLFNAFIWCVYYITTAARPVAWPDADRIVGSEGWQRSSGNWTRGYSHCHFLARDLVASACTCPSQAPQRQCKKPISLTKSNFSKTKLFMIFNFFVSQFFIIFLQCLQFVTFNLITVSFHHKNYILIIFIIFCKNYVF